MFLFSKIELDMNKKDLQRFIYFFTHNKSLTHQQMIKRDKLLARDYFDKKQTISDEGQNASTDNNCGHRASVEENYVNPQFQQEILKAINQDEVLKYTCHLIDSQETVEHICKLTGTQTYDFIKHADLINERFGNLIAKYKKEHKYLSRKMYSLVSTYLTGAYRTKQGEERGVWSSNDITENWQCEDIRKWAEENPGIVPNPGNIVTKSQKSTGFRLRKAYKDRRTGKRIINFAQLVLCFKAMFHIRQDNSAKMLLERVNMELTDQYADKVNISFSKNKFYESVELFTDVDKFCQSYKRIVELCIEHEKHGCANIEVQFYNDIETKHTYLSIHHLNSIYGKTALNAQRIGESQSRMIPKLINGFCDLYVKADFEDGIRAEVNLWDALPIGVKTIEEEVNGVQYILRF